MPVDLIATNFTCPNFYSCTLTSNLDACKELIGNGLKNLCQNVTTEVLTMKPTSCGWKGRSTCYVPTSTGFPGPERFMAMVHNETQEKIYNYVTGNWRLLAGVGVGILALGVIIKLVRTPNEYLSTKDEHQLSAMLDYADVSAGHWNGSRIHFLGAREYTTFRDVANRIEQLYANSVEFMHKRQKTYEWSQKPTRPRLSEISGAIVSAPFTLAEDALKYFSSGKPELSEVEEAQVQKAMQWREKAYGQLNSLFAKSQTRQNRLTGFWDNALDRVSSWRAKDISQDREILAQMVANRPIREPEPVVKTEEKPSVAVVEEKITPNRLTFAKEAIWNVARLVRDLALTVLYSIWIFSTSWKSNIASSARNVAEDFSNLRNAMLGIFSPESATLK